MYFMRLFLYSSVNKPKYRDPIGLLGYCTSLMRYGTHDRVSCASADVDAGGSVFEAECAEAGAPNRGQGRLGAARRGAKLASWRDVRKHRAQWRERQLPFVCNARAVPIRAQLMRLIYF